MPQDAEAEASDNCVLYWLSTRLDVQTVNLGASFTTHPRLLYCSSSL
jgi:hypothetical protein